ncbi:MAG: phage head morphogenesis protein [Bacteroidales bacterium]|nr:phage head morphogenesis protein [Bacteroidales bacterium]
MSDYAHRATDEALADLEKRISQVYADASNEMQGTVTEYFEQFAARDRAQAAALEAGEITEREYKQWRLTQLSRGEKYKTMQSELAERFVEADEVAVSYVNDATPGIYSLNRNYSAYTIEQAGADVSFTLYDESTVRRLITEQPNLMPHYPAARAVRRGIDLAYGKQQITASITSGILQGKDIYKIAGDLMSRISTMSEESAVRTARTAFTAAENAGRQDSYEAAEEMGIPMQKRWVATLDDRTRESHIEADGQTVGVDENFEVGDDELEYPGDPGGEPCEIYNCRCTVIAVVDGNEYKDAERRGDGERFEEWLSERENDEETPLLKALEDSNIGYNQVSRLSEMLTEEQIVEKLAGGDKTSGSCASLAMAYAANKCGLDVTDYRGGESQDFFCKNYWNLTTGDNAILSSSVYTARSSVTAGNKALKEIETGKEYILAAGRHAAVVQKTEDGALQYLELQSPYDNNGWTNFDGNPRYTLSERFGCSGTGANYAANLTDIESFRDNEQMETVLGYLNTAANEQHKGTNGSVK